MISHLWINEIQFYLIVKSEIRNWQLPPHDIWGDDSLIMSTTISTEQEAVSDFLCTINLFIDQLSRHLSDTKINGISVIGILFMAFRSGARTIPCWGTPKTSLTWPSTSLIRNQAQAPWNQPIFHFMSHPGYNTHQYLLQVITKYIPVFRAPALDEADTDRAHSRQLIYCLESLIYRVPQKLCKCLIVKDLQMTTCKKKQNKKMRDTCWLKSLLITS